MQQQTKALFSAAASPSKLTLSSWQLLAITRTGETLTSGKWKYLGQDKTLSSVWWLMMLVLCLQSFWCLLLWGETIAGLNRETHNCVCMPVMMQKDKHFQFCYDRMWLFTKYGYLQKCQTRRCLCHHEGLYCLMVVSVQTVAHGCDTCISVCCLSVAAFLVCNCLPVDVSSLLHMSSSICHHSLEGLLQRLPRTCIVVSGTALDKGTSSYSRVLAGSVTTCHLVLGRKHAWYSMCNRSIFAWCLVKTHINSTQFNQAISNNIMMIGSPANWVQFSMCLQISNEQRPRN